MNNDQELIILKHDLQILNKTQDIYLLSLLDQAKSLISREGIKNDKTDDYNMAVIDYAAFLFRKRAGIEKVMPKHLRYELNNILFSQKMK